MWTPPERIAEFHPNDLKTLSDLEDAEYWLDGAVLSLDKQMRRYGTENPEWFDRTMRAKMATLRKLKRVQQLIARENGEVALALEVLRIVRLDAAENLDREATNILGEAMDNLSATEVQP